MKRQSDMDDQGARLRVCCLPISGMENPYQHLMMEGLRRDGRLEVRHGAPGKFFAALRTVLSCRPDVIHYDWIHRYFLRRERWWTWLHAPVFVAELLVVRYVLGCRIVWTMHNLSTHDAASSRIELWVRRHFARLCDWIRVFDDSTVRRASTLLKTSKKRFRVVPEGSYLSYYPDTISQEQARERLGVEKGALVLLYLGLVRPYKGLEDLLDAFAAQRRPHWKLIIAGMPLVDEYAQAIRERAKQINGVELFLEFVADEELQVFFNASDVVVLPFKKIENSGSVLLAMGFGKPVITPSAGALAQRLEQQTELLYEQGDLEGAVAKLRDMSVSHLQDLGTRNRTAAKSYRWEDFAKLFGEAVSDPDAAKDSEQQLVGSAL